MTLTICDIRHVHVTANCPQCNKPSGTDKGNCSVRDLKPVQGFFCEEHGEWEEPIDWGAELNKLIAANKEQQ